MEGTTAAVSDDLKINSTDNISIWQYGIRPLRAHITPWEFTQGEDGSGYDAVQSPSTTIKSTTTYLDAGDVATQLKKNEFYAFEQGTPVTTKFDGSPVGKPDVISGEKVQTVAVHMKKGAKQPGSIEDVAAFITSSNDTSSRIVENTTGESGENYFQFTPQKSGQYVFATVLVENSSETGLAPAGNGNLTAESNVTVVGFDYFVVQQGSSQVSSPDVAAIGNNVSVTADASNLSSDTVTHTVVLLDEDTLANQEQTITLDGSNISEINSTIENVEGATDIHEDANFLGNELPPSRYNGNTNLISLLDRLSGNSTNVTATDNTTIYASVNSTVGGPTETVTLRTSENFSAGEYSIIHFATAQNGTETLTATDSVNLTEGVPLNVNASAVEIQQGDSVTLNVTRADTEERVSGANVTYNGQTFTTDANGQVTFTPLESGTAKVTKEPENGTAFVSTSIDLWVIKPEMELVDYGVSSTAIGANETLTVNATVRNYGTFDGQFALDLKKDGQVVDSKTVTVPANDTHTEQFSLTFDTDGTHNVTVNDEAPTMIFVGDAADFSSSLTVPTEVEKGTIPVNATVSNSGNLDVTSGVRVVVQAQAEGSSTWTDLVNKTVTLNAGDSVDLNTTLSRTEARNYTVRVVADPDDEFTEPIEENNNVSANITGGPLAKGTVVEADGDAAVDDQVWVLNRDASETNQSWFVGQTFTDDQGRYLAPILSDTNQTVGYVQGDPSGMDGANFARDGSPDIYTLADINGSDSILDLGTTNLPDAGVLNITVVDQDGNPVENASIAVLHKNDGVRSGVAFNSSANGLFPVGEDGKTGIELSGDVMVRVKPPENSSKFANRTYTKNLTVDTTGDNVTFTLAEAADLSPSLDVDQKQTFGDGVTANVTVSNDGLVNVSNSTVNLTVDPASGPAKTFTKHTGTIEARNEANNSTTLTFDLTDFAADNLLGDLADGNAKVTATVDPADDIVETDETNNRAVNSTRVVYADPAVRIEGQSTALQSQQATYVVYTENNGTAATGEFNVTVDYGDGTTENVTISQLNATEANATTLTHTFSTSGDKTVTANVSDGIPFSNNESTKNVTVKAFELNLTDENVSVPPRVENNTTFTVLAGFETNHPSTTNATLDLPTGLELADGETATHEVQTTATGGVTAWKVRANTTEDIDNAQLNVSVEAFGESDTASATTNVTLPKVMHRVTNSTTLNTSTTETLALNVSDATTYEHNLTVNVQAGADGRTLRGLEYLFWYPYGCVEQTTTQMMSALRTDQYYRDGAIPDSYDRDRANTTVSQGISKLADEPTPGFYANISQHDNGAWSMFGYNPNGDLFYTIYALQGSSAVSDDTVQSNRTSVNNSLKNISQSGAVLWLADKQQESGANAGSIRPSGYFLRDRVSATAYTAVAVDRAEDDLNASATAAADNFSVDAAVYLIDEQNAAGNWSTGTSQSYYDATGREVQQTAFAVRALASLNESQRAEVNNQTSTNVSAAIDSGVQWLADNQNGDGSWKGYWSSPYWNNVGEKARSTGNVILALNAAEGYTASNNTTVSTGVNYLVGIYQEGGSFGNTRATGVAIDALTTADQRGSGAQTVTIEINSSTSRPVTVNSSSPTAEVTFTTDELVSLRENGTITLTTANDSLVVIGAESEQLVNEQEYEDSN
ncbi:CARDB domain-containing protein [Haloferax sp. S1W]|uniref:CARDB domain-containing protein n=1 Tax=Haloferax sp. S1W TaxID=3377110 RepID=UPI0037C80369